MTFPGNSNDNWNPLHHLKAFKSKAADGIRTHELLMIRAQKPYESAALTGLSHGGPTDETTVPDLSIAILGNALNFMRQLWQECADVGYKPDRLGSTPVHQFGNCCGIYVYAYRFHI